LITEASKHVECKGTYLGGVYWHEPDEKNTGENTGVRS